MYACVRIQLPIVYHECLRSGTLNFYAIALMEFPTQLLVLFPRVMLLLASLTVARRIRRSTMSAPPLGFFVVPSLFGTSGDFSKPVVDRCTRNTEGSLALRIIYAFSNAVDARFELFDRVKRKSSLPLAPGPRPASPKCIEDKSRVVAIGSLSGRVKPTTAWTISS